MNIEPIATTTAQDGSGVTFFSVMGALILSFGFAAYYMIRKGGTWNPDTVEDPLRIESPIVPVEMPVVPILGLKSIYNVAKLCLGDRLTLNPSVPRELGCVQAVSFVLSRAGFNVPEKGIDGVNALIDWLLDNGFQESTGPVPGAVITAHRSRATDPAFAHAGICGETHIMSNTSYTDPTKGLTSGLFQANYTYSGWNNYFTIHNCTTRYFTPVLT